MASQVESIKWIAGKFLVDGFAFQHPRCVHYFLTHFHSDHTVGLRKSFKDGIIHCTAVTANLLVHDMGMSAAYIHVMEYETPVVIDGIKVTATPANHCPGACMLIFEVPSCSPGGMPEVILHTGDCRWQSWMLQGQTLKSLRVDTLYLDTTYAAAKHTLPPQEQAIQAMVDAMKEALVQEPDTLFVMAAYHIGKERAFLGAARALGCKVWVTPAKRHVLGLLDLPKADMQLLADKEEDAQLHVVHWGLKPESLQRFLHGPAGPGGDKVHQQGQGQALAQDAWTAAQGVDAGPGGDVNLRQGQGQGQASVLDACTSARGVDAGPGGYKAPQQGQGQALAQDAWTATQGVDAGPGGDKDLRQRQGQGQASVLDAWNAAQGIDAGPGGDKVSQQGQGQGQALAQDAWTAAQGVDAGPELTDAEAAALRGQRWKHVMGIRPTGWTMRKGGRPHVWRQGTVSLMGVPYSEHSSWDELRDCVRSLKPSKLVPTVNVETPTKMRAMIDKFADLMDNRQNKSRIPYYLKPRLTLHTSQECGGPLPHSMSSPLPVATQQLCDIACDGPCDKPCKAPCDDTVFAGSCGMQLEWSRSAGAPAGPACGRSSQPLHAGRVQQLNQGAAAGVVSRKVKGTQADVDGDEHDVIVIGSEEEEAWALPCASAGAPSSSVDEDEGMDVNSKLPSCFPASWANPEQQAFRIVPGGRCHALLHVCLALMWTWILVWISRWRAGC